MQAWLADNAVWKNTSRTEELDRDMAKFPNNGTPKQQMHQLLESRGRELSIEAAKQELREHKSKAVDRNPFSSLMGKIIRVGLEFRLDLLQLPGFGSNKPVARTLLTGFRSNEPATGQWPTGKDGCQLATKYCPWIDEVEACVTKWRQHKQGEVSNLTASLGSFLTSPWSSGLHRVGVVDNLDQLLLHLRGIEPQVRILTFDVASAMHQEFTGDELDHAEQLLEIPGRHEEAVLRAAGVIAGVVLERHLSNVVDAVSANLPASERYPREGKKHGLERYTNWLIGKGAIHKTERTPLKGLAFIRNCCDHAPDGNLRAPTREEVERLIKDTRRYTSEIAPPPPSL